MAKRRKRDQEKAAESTGETIVGLVIVDSEQGLAGRVLVTLVKRNREHGLPWNRLRVGVPVLLSHQGQPTDDESAYQGVVSARSTTTLQLALNTSPEGDLFRVDLSPDEITRKRLKRALRTIKVARGRLAELRSILLGNKEPRFGAEPQIEFASQLNSSQQAAVRFACSAEDVAVIHGPPGTGKTTTVVEFIHQAVIGEQKVLATAPSNTAVDNLLERLVDLGINAVRLGHPARVDVRLREHTLDYLVEKHDNRPIIKNMLREADALYRKADRYTRAKPPPGARREARAEAKRLRTDARLLEQQAVDHVLERAEVICSTTAIDDELLSKRSFDLAVVDEACQSTEPGCWVPLLYANKLVLAGDHCQLPPTVISNEAASEGFALSMQERLVRELGPTISRLLTVQYRMHADIMRFSADYFYDADLDADMSVASHILSEIPTVLSSSLTNEPLRFVDTAGAGWDEELEPDGESRRNPREADRVLQMVQSLLEAGVHEYQIAVITPYAAQVRWLRQHWTGDSLEIDTVDGFQGREREAVIISLVRSNSNGEIGFLADTRRMNVAMTRARRNLIVIGDSATLGRNEFYTAMLEHFENCGAYHTVWEDN